MRDKRVSLHPDVVNGVQVRPYLSSGRGDGYVARLSFFLLMMTALLVFLICVLGGQSIGAFSIGPGCMLESILFQVNGSIHVTHSSGV